MFVVIFFIAKLCIKGSERLEIVTGSSSFLQKTTNQPKPNQDVQAGKISKIIISFIFIFLFIKILFALFRF